MVKNNYAELLMYVVTFSSQRSSERTEIQCCKQLVAKCQQRQVIRVVLHKYRQTERQF